MTACPACHTAFEEQDGRFCGRCGADLGRADADPLVGELVDGRYRVVSKLGQGGMGTVYRVEHVRMGKAAAMKLLHPAMSQDRELLARFQREAETVSRLSHPNIVQVFDFGRHRGAMYLVMELVRGEDLGAILLRDGPLPFPRARTILVQVCEALTEAHEAGIVHRDLKPENLLVSRARDGRDFVKVLDFGLAKLRDREELNEVTARGSLVGTPYYMSPEQIRAEALDARSDIYSLGALAYRMLTGEPPFDAATPVAVLTQHLTERVVPPSLRRPDLDLPPIADEIVLKAMAKEPAERFPSAEALRQALDEAPQISQPLDVSSRGQRRRDSDAATSSSSEPLRREDLDAYERHLRRRRWLGLGVPIVLMGVIGVGVFMRLRTGAAPSGEEREPNDTAAQAGLLSNGVTVRGHIGRCLSPEESDRDFYRLEVKGRDQKLRLATTGLPGMDLKLTLFDAQGAKLFEVDEAGPGEGELAPNLRLKDPGDYYLSVREVWVAGKPATEDPVNWYTLNADWAPLGALEEAEPDDDPSHATPVPLDQPMRGFLSAARDADYFYPRGDGGGRLGAKVSGIPGVDLRLVILPQGTGPAQSGRGGGLPPGAQVIDEGGVGAPESVSGVRWPLGAAGPVVVVERKADGADSREGRDAREGREPRSGRDSPRPPRALVGADVAYELVLHLAP